MQLDDARALLAVEIPHQIGGGGMNVLLIGSGGREHALAWKLAQSPRLKKLFAAPGNPGIARHAELAAIDIADHEAVIRFCVDKAIDLVVVGPEVPLVAGLVDDLEAAGIPAFGPRKAAAQLEGSKAYTKELCATYDIPTARHRSFVEAAGAKSYVRQKGAPIVIKADGLAAGKGVVVATTVAEAEAAVDMMFEGGLGAAGESVVIEEFMTGEEVSYFCLIDGDKVLPFGSAQDHKRVFDGDEGPNTGGMGAYSPAPVFTPEIERRVLEEIVRPTARAMKALGNPFRGVLFAGLMLTPEGPKLVEYNVRFGDPECQVLMSRLERRSSGNPLGHGQRHARQGRRILVGPGGDHRGAGRQGLSGRAAEGFGNPQSPSRGSTPRRVRIPRRHAPGWRQAIGMGRPGT